MILRGGGGAGAFEAGEPVAGIVQGDVGFEHSGADTGDAAAAGAAGDGPRTVTVPSGFLMRTVMFVGSVGVPATVKVAWGVQMSPWSLCCICAKLVLLIGDGNGRPG